jgi:hypothetical protein
VCEVKNYCFRQVLRDILKSSARSTQQIRCRPTAPQAPRNRIRANADNRKASRPSLFELPPKAVTPLVDQHVPHFRFRRISPQWFLVSRFVAKTRPAFRGLWRKSGIDRYRRDFLHSRWEPTPPLTFDQLIGVLQQHFAAMPRILARRERVERSKFGITHATVDRRVCTLFAGHSSSCRRLRRICVHRG